MASGLTLKDFNAVTVSGCHFIGAHFDPDDGRWVGLYDGQEIVRHPDEMVAMDIVRGHARHEAALEEWAALEKSMGLSA